MSVATFEDLKEAMYLMEYGSGTRPYIMEWYDEVYLPAFAKLIKPNFRVDDNSGKTINESTIGLNIRQLVDATVDIQNRALTDNNLRDRYLKPLYNEGFINILKSECDRRSYISFPLIKAGKIQIYTTDIAHTKYLESGGSNVIDLTTFPSKQYLNIWFSTIQKYTTESGLKCNKIISHDNRVLDVHTLVEEYYSNPENYFEESSMTPGLAPYYTEGPYPVRSDTSDPSASLLSPDELMNPLLKYRLMLQYRRSTFLTKLQSQHLKSKSEPKTTCPSCSEALDPDLFYQRLHRC